MKTSGAPRRSRRASVRRVFLAVVTGRRLAEDLGAGGTARRVSIDVVDVDAQDLGVFPPAARGLTMLSSPGLSPPDATMIKPCRIRASECSMRPLRPRP